MALCATMTLGLPGMDICRRCGVGWKESWIADALDDAGKACINICGGCDMFFEVRFPNPFNEDANLEQ
jgi:hypothetical protein